LPLLPWKISKACRVNVVYIRVVHAVAQSEQFQLHGTPLTLAAGNSPNETVAEHPAPGIIWTQYNTGIVVIAENNVQKYLQCNKPYSKTITTVTIVIWFNFYFIFK
jgi:hypothetical protein